MKNLILKSLFIFLLPLLSFSQKTSPFKYNYKFVAPNIVDTSFITLSIENLNKDSIKLTGNLITNKKDTLLFGILSLSNNLVSYNIMANENGLITKTIKKGVYNYSINTLNSRHLRNDSILLNENKKINLSIIQLKRGFEVYNIHSKKQLSKQEIIKITKCIMANHPFNNCNKKNEYYITIEY